MLNCHMDDWTDQDLADFRRRLEASLRELVQPTDAATEAGKVVTLDQQSVGRLSRMDALQAQAMAQETERRRMLNVRKVEAALVRLEEGEYGYCTVCGAIIRRERLDLDPAAATCIEHAK